MELGYAIGVHGSLKRDIDLIAVPWADEAVHPAELAEAVRQVAASCNNGVAFMDSVEQSCEWHRNGCQPYGKPWGRMCWCFHFGGGPYIDLSVVPRSPSDIPDAPGD